jgi:hypothetical protein
MIIIPPVGAERETETVIVKFGVVSQQFYWRDRGKPRQY